MEKNKNDDGGVVNVNSTFHKEKSGVSKLLIAVGIILAIAAIVAITTRDDGHILKSEYSMGEVGYLDDIEVTLKEASYINNGTGIEVTFEITNRTNNTITITPDDYFVFYDINKVQIPNKYENDKNIVKKDEKVSYKLQYDVTEKELYEIYFYSQVVENNIKFSFKSSDITENRIDEDNVEATNSFE